MSNFCRFLSLGKPTEIGYFAYRDSMALFTQARRSHRPIAQWAGFFMTYGDGDIQHSPECPVQGEMLGDYCASLAAYLLEHPDDTGIVAKHWPYSLELAKVEFLATLRHDPSKRRWYSRHELRASAASGKANDRRWDLIPEYADGSLKAVCRLFDFFGTFGYDLLSTYVASREVAKIMSGTCYGQGIEADLGLTERHVGDAVEALDHIVQGYKMTEGGRRCVECWTRNQDNDRANAERKRQAEASKASAASETFFVPEKATESIAEAAAVMS